MAEEATQQSIFLFHGEDTYSSHKKLQHWKNAFQEKYGEASNIEVYEGKELKIPIFNTNLETLPFLCDKRMIIIKNYLKSAKAEDQKKVAKIIERTPDFVILIFQEDETPDKRLSLYKKLKKIGKEEEFKNMTPAQLTQWILKEAKTREFIISPTVANYLSQHCGNELWRISSELEKIGVFAGENPITQAIIDDQVTPSLSASIFKLTDLLSERNSKESLKILQILKDSGEDLTRVFFMIVRHFRILIQVHYMVSKNEPSHSITKRLKQHPFVIQKTSSQAKNFTSEQLETIYEKLLEIDTKFKTGQIKTYQGDDREFQLAIEKLIIDCCS